MKPDSHTVYHFEVTLEEVDPRIWREIQVPNDYSFWDLHVAIQAGTRPAFYTPLKTTRPVSAWAQRGALWRRLAQNLRQARGGPFVLTSRK